MAEKYTLTAIHETDPDFGTGSAWIKEKTYMSKDGISLLHLIRHVETGAKVQIRDFELKRDYELVEEN